MVMPPVRVPRFFVPTAALRPLGSWYWPAMAGKSLHQTNGILQPKADAMTDLPAATILVPKTRRGPQLPYDVVTLGYDARFLRRKRLVTAHGEGFLVDLPETTNLSEGDCFQLADGRLIEVISAEEKLIEVRATDLPRLAWHIGNRHTPCQIEADRLLIREDHVLEQMLRQLGAVLRKIEEPFTPEGGAYGHGRTMGHDHGHIHHHSSHRHQDDDSAPEAEG